MLGKLFNFGGSSSTKEAGGEAGGQKRERSGSYGDGKNTGKKSAKQQQKIINQKLEDAFKGDFDDNIEAGLDSNGAAQSSNGVAQSQGWNDPPQ